MSEVNINYKGSKIAGMDASGTKTLLTEGKYCEDDIEVVYTRPSAGGDDFIVTITWDDTNQIWVPDKTYNEIYQADRQHKKIITSVNKQYYSDIVASDGIMGQDWFRFEIVTRIDTHTFEVAILDLLSTNEVVWEEDELYTLSN